MMMQVVRDAKGKVINIGPWAFVRDKDQRILNPLPAGAYEDTAEIVEDEDGGKHEKCVLLPKQALRLLAGTDHIVAKASEQDLALNPEWKFWRQQLRDIVNGVLSDIPAEPPRYGAPKIEEQHTLLVLATILIFHNLCGVLIRTRRQRVKNALILVPNKCPRSDINDLAFGISYNLHHHIATHPVLPVPLSLTYSVVFAPPSVLVHKDLSLIHI